MMELIVQGSKETSLHDFLISINGLEITISKGTYYQAGTVRFTTEEATVLTIAAPGDYTLWLTDTGFVLADTMPTNTIDRLLWFTATETELVNVHFVKVVDVNAG